MMNLLQWQRLIRDFREERCILMLGPRMPGVLVNDSWRSIGEEFSIFLTSFLVDSGISYDRQSKRDLAYIAQQFLSIEGARRVDLEDIAKDFLSQNTKSIPDIYHQLARLPMHLIINTTPDDYMERALREQGKPCVTYHYNFQRDNERPIEADMITVERPMVYNLFGTMAEAESLVLTDNNQLEFIRNVVKDDPRIPDEILGQFDHRKTYLFLGFDLENWQFRLLLDSLNLREENSTFSPQTPHYPLSQKTREFYSKRFSFYFIDSEMSGFISELNTKVQPKEREEDGEKTIKKIFLIADAKDQSLLEEMEKWLRQMEANKEIEVWSTRRFEAGTDRDEILAKIREVDVILPLLSPDFLANDELYRSELETALEQDRANKAQVYPVLLRHSDWESNTDLSRLAPLPVSKNPVTDVGDWDSQDEAWLDIIKELKRRIG